MENRIKSTLDDYARAYCAKDIDAMMAVFDDSDNISAIGTGAEELCVGRTQVKELFARNFEEATANKFEWLWVDTRILDNHAVMSVRMIIHLNYQGEDLCVPIRWTVVLKEKNGNWVWVHRHASTPAANQDEGEAYPTER